MMEFTNKFTAYRFNHSAIISYLWQELNLHLTNRRGFKPRASTNSATQVKLSTRIEPIVHTGNEPVQRPLKQQKINKNLQDCNYLWCIIPNTSVLRKKLKLNWSLTTTIFLNWFYLIWLLRWFTSSNNIQIYWLQIFK
jgi:hypothetical protein